MTGTSRNDDKHKHLVEVEESCLDSDVLLTPRIRNVMIPKPKTWYGKKPDVKIVKKIVEVPLLYEKIVYRTIELKVPRPVEVLRYKPRQLKHENVREILKPSGLKFEVPTPYSLLVEKNVPNYVNIAKPCIVSERCRPRVHLGDVKEVDSLVYEPELIPVDIKIPKLISNEILTVGKRVKYININNLSPAKWNTLVLKLNPELCRTGQTTHMPLYRNESGAIIAYDPSLVTGPL